MLRKSLRSLRPTPHYWLCIPRQHKGFLTFLARALWLQAIPALLPAWGSQWTEDLSTLGPFLGFLYRGWLPYLAVFVLALLGHCVWSMALDRETWWGSCPICCMHIAKNSFSFITNAGPKQSPYPLGLQNTNMQPKSPKPLSVRPPSCSFLPLAWILLNFSELIQGIMECERWSQTYSETATLVSSGTVVPSKHLTQ